jgi:hypothetical protein
MQSACRGGLPNLPEDHPLSEGYAGPEARRVRAEEYQREFHRKWEEEHAQAPAQRLFFGVVEIADRLARNPRNLTIDRAIRQRIGGDLNEWMQTQQFRTGEVVMLGGDPPDFRAVKLPLPLADGRTVRILPAIMALRRDACRRYVEARVELPGAASLLSEWFGAGPEPVSAPRVGAAKPGLSAGEQRTKDQQPRRGPKPGETGFNTADRALFEVIEEMQAKGEARSAIAAARILVKKGKVAGGGSDENRANRLARGYGKRNSKPTPSKVREFSLHNRYILTTNQIKHFDEGMP